MPDPTCPPIEYIDSVSAALVNVGKTLVGSEHISDVGAWPRYIWVPSSEAWTADAPNNAIAVGAFATTFEVHVWGRDYVHAWRMRGALLTALANDALGSFNIGPAFWPPRGKGTAGTLCVQTVSITIPISRQQFPTAPGGEITDEEPTLGRATHLGTITPVP